MQGLSCRCTRSAGSELPFQADVLRAVSRDLQFVRKKATIEMGSRSGQTSETLIFIRDNSVGFDMACADKLFGVFQRLHRADEFEGTGIGLASVRRIIARHGGRTWAQGKAEQGAALYFSLPLILETMADERRQG